jgi:HlyD family secretion protein
MTATVDIRTQKEANARCLPVEAVTTRQDSASEKMLEVVFVVENGVVRQAQVETGIQDERFISIGNSLASDQELQVVRGPFEAVSRKLNDGDKVTVKAAK